MRLAYPGFAAVTRGNGDPVELGYALSAEEHRRRISSATHAWPRRPASVRADLGSLSSVDDEQGHSRFVWGVLGAIAQATTELRIGTGVTCPLIRIHPAIVAHAAATTPGHDAGAVLPRCGDGRESERARPRRTWPAPDERLDMLEEAVRLIRELWQGDYHTHRGTHYTVENLRLFTSRKTRRTSRWPRCSRKPPS